MVYTDLMMAYCGGDGGGGVGSCREMVFVKKQSHFVMKMMA